MDNLIYPILIVIFILTFGLMVITAKARHKGLLKFYTEGGYIGVKDSPIPDPFTLDNIEHYACSRGYITKDLPYTLILATRPRASRHASEREFIGFHINNHPKLTDEWLAGWAQMVADRGDFWAVQAGFEQKTLRSLCGAPEGFPIRALRIGGGILLAWEEYCTRENIEIHIKEVVDSLCNPPRQQSAPNPPLLKTTGITDKKFLFAYAWGEGPNQHCGLSWTP